MAELALTWDLERVRNEFAFNASVRTDIEGLAASVSRLFAPRRDIRDVSVLNDVSYLAVRIRSFTVLENVQLSFETDSGTAWVVLPLT